MDTLQNGRGVAVRLRSILPFQPTRPRQNLRARNIERTLLGLRQIGQNSDPVIKSFAFNGPEIILPLLQKTCRVMEGVHGAFSLGVARPAARRSGSEAV